MEQEAQNPEQPRDGDPAAGQRPVGGRPSLRKRLTSAVVWSFLGRVVSLSTFFLTHILLGRLMTKEDYSAYVLVAAAVTIGTMLGSAGTPQILIRAIRQNVDASRALSSCLRLVLVVAAIGTATCVVSAGYLGDAEQWDGLRDHPLGVSLWAGTAALCLVIGSALQGLDDFRSAVLVAAKNGGFLPNVLFLASLPILYESGRLDIGAVIALRVAIQVVTVCVALIVVSRRTRTASFLPKEKGEAQPAFEPTPMGFFGESWHILIVQLAILGINEMDVIVVASLVSETAVSDYGAARTLINLIRAPILIAGVSLGPFIAELYQAGETEKLQKVLRGAATLIGIPGAAALCLVALFPDWVIWLSYGDKYQGAEPLLACLALGQLVFVITGLNGQALVMTGYQRHLAAISLFTFAMYVVLAPVIVGAFGVLGAAGLNSALVATQNLLVTAAVRLKAGLWTTASPSLAGVREAVRSLRGKRVQISRQTKERVL